MGEAEESDALNTGLEQQLGERINRGQLKVEGDSGAATGAPRVAPEDDVSEARELRQVRLFSLGVNCG